jgi:hypothetical protein
MGDINPHLKALTDMPDDLRSLIPDHGATVTKLLNTCVPPVLEWAQIFLSAKGLLVPSELNVGIDDVLTMEVLSGIFINNVLAALKL